MMGAAAVAAAPCKLPSAVRRLDEDSSAVPIQFVSVRSPEESTLNTNAPDTSPASRLRKCSVLCAACASRSCTLWALLFTKSKALPLIEPIVDSDFFRILLTDAALNSFETKASIAFAARCTLDTSTCAACAACAALATASACRVASSFSCASWAVSSACRCCSACTAASCAR